MSDYIVFGYKLRKVIDFKKHLKSIMKQVQQNDHLRRKFKYVFGDGKVTIMRKDKEYMAVIWIVEKTHELYTTQKNESIVYFLVKEGLVSVEPEKRAMYFL
jgi:hypothetical protein